MHDPVIGVRSTVFFSFFYYSNYFNQKFDESKISITKVSKLLLILFRDKIKICKVLEFLLCNIICRGLSVYHVLNFVLQIRVHFDIFSRGFPREQHQ